MLAYMSQLFLSQEITLTKGHLGPKLLPKSLLTQPAFLSIQSSSLDCHIYKVLSIRTSQMCWMHISKVSQLQRHGVFSIFQDKDTKMCSMACQLLLL